MQYRTRLWPHFTSKYQQTSDADLHEFYQHSQGIFVKDPHFNL
jgi:hypothetical protein